MMSKSIHSIAPAIFGLCVFLFFWKIFPCHLHFHEQFQLFLFTKNYFIETCSRPGGFSNYTGQFVTQFYISSLVGALLFSSMLTGLQQLVYAIMRRFRRSENIHSVALFLSFLPSLFYWYLFCDEDWQTGGVIALIFTLLAALIGTFPKSHSLRRIYLFASIPVLYWLAGGAVILNVIFLIGYEFQNSRKESKTLNQKFLYMVAVFFASSLPFLAKLFLQQYPLNRYWWGVDYVHFISYTPFIIVYLWMLIFLIVVVVSLLPGRIQRAKNTLLIQLLTIPALLLVIYFVMMKQGYPQNLHVEKMMTYDYHCRMQNWDKVIELAKLKPPAGSLTLACFNLALYQIGQSPDDYFQNGSEGLLLPFQKDFMMSMIGSEPYYYLGFVNTAQRFTFEAMEGFPGNQKSVRCIKRLAETNLINGYYELASKYLYLLEHTLFYRNWAKETRKFLYDEAKIDAHPEWGKIRQLQSIHHE